jgi:hypothetical protein
MIRIKEEDYKKKKELYCKNRNRTQPEDIGSDKVGKKERDTTSSDKYHLIKQVILLPLIKLVILHYLI